MGTLRKKVRTMTTASKVMSIAAKQIGVCESPANSNKQKYGKAYGWNGTYWCAQLVWWCGWAAAGKKQSENPIAKSASAADIQELTVKQKGGKWILPQNGTRCGQSVSKAREMRKGYLKKAKPGDIVSFDFGVMDGWRDHTGLVENVSGDYIYCIEGNTSKSGSQSNGGMVCRQRRSYLSICAAVRPKYDGASDTQASFEFPSRGYFKVGDKGDNVEKVQKYLNRATKGAFDYTLKVDGEFGEKTERTCKFMQDVRHLVVDGEFGQKSLEECKKTVTIPMMAVNFGVMIAKDNTFTYGVGQRAHRYGCYFCQTNTGPKKKLKEREDEPHYVKDKNGKKHTYTKTYCCNPYVTACYAHGAEIEDILKACESGSGFGLSVKSCTRFKGIKKVGACKSVAFGKLQVGDIILCEHHMWMYTGDDWLVEASGEGWGIDSIAHKRGAKARYAKYQKDKTAYVVRYKG